MFRINDDISLHYRIAQPKQGETKRCIVLLHGFVSHLETFMYIQQQLADDYQAQVLSFDRFCFGRSTRQKSYSEESMFYFTEEGQLQMAERIIHALKAHNDVILVGNSAGGRMAMQLYLRNPSLIRGLFLLAPAISSVRRSKALFQIPGASFLISKLCRWIPAPFRIAYHDPDRVLRDVELSRSYSDLCLLPGWGESLVLFAKNMTNSDLKPQMDNKEFHSVPIMIVTGDDDRVVLTKDSQAHHDRLKELNHPQLMYVEIPNCGHLPQEECPDKVMDAFQQFAKAMAIY
jgi:pimeloyl-ACP methyl ester carboxylesterase